MNLIESFHIGRRVVDDGVEAAEDGIGLAMRRRPALAQPFFLDRRHAKDLAHLGHLEVEIGEPLDAVEDGLRDVVRVPELVRPKRERTWEQADGLGDAVALIREVPLGRRATELRASDRPSRRAGCCRARAERAWRAAGP